VLAEFAINNKAYSTTKASLFMANYEKELRMGIDIKKKKDGENNRVYSKNEKSAKKSRSSVKKSTERDKATNK